MAGRKFERSKWPMGSDHGAREKKRYNFPKIKMGKRISLEEVAGYTLEQVKALIEASDPTAFIRKTKGKKVNPKLNQRIKISIKRRLLKPTAVKTTSAKKTSSVKLSRKVRPNLIDQDS